jgi:hypothetical protein
LIHRLGLPLSVSVAQLCAAVLVLGRPDLRLALAFLGGGWPTAAETVAALQVLVWAIVLGVIGSSVVATIRELAYRGVRSPRWRERSALAIGALVLAAGAAHHFSYQVGMSGGSIEEARSVLGR